MAVVGAIVATVLAAPSAAEEEPAASLVPLEAFADLTAGVIAAADDPYPLTPGDAVAGARELVPEVVREVPVSGALVARTHDELEALERTIITNRVERDRALADLERLHEERQAHRARYAALRERRRRASLEAEELRGELAQLAVAAYVGAGTPGAMLDLDTSVATESGRQQAIVDAVDATLRDRLEATEAVAAQAGLDADAARDELSRVAGQIDDATARRDTALATLASAEPELPRVQALYRDHFMLARVDGADFEVVALHAYRNAAGRVAEERPACRLPWTVLAGIGRVESRHGTYGGASLRADGTTSRRILGVALDGSPGIMNIPDTDGGALDGDPNFDRAVGPMQFIPTTWRMVARDGDGDGRRDPHNLYDAALAAAVYLCRGGERLDRPVGLTRAILTYNRSQAYVDAVFGHHRRYQRLGLP